MPFKIDDQAVLHSKHSVGFQIRVTFDKYVGCHRLVAGSTDDEMNMSRTEGMAPHSIKHLANGSVRWDRVKTGLARAKPIPSISPGTKHAASIEWRYNTGLLHVVKPILVAVPYIEGGVCDRLATGVEHSPGY